MIRFKHKSISIFLGSALLLSPILWAQDSGPEGNLHGKKGPKPSRNGPPGLEKRGEKRSFADMLEHLGEKLNLSDEQKQQAMNLASQYEEKAKEMQTSLEHLADQLREMQGNPTGHEEKMIELGRMMGETRVKHAMLRHEFMTAVRGLLSAEQTEKLDEMKANADKKREEFAKMSPEEKKEAMSRHMQRRDGEKTNAGPSQREDFREKIKNMSTEEREAFKEKMREKFGKKDGEKRHGKGKDGKGKDADESAVTDPLAPPVTDGSSSDFISQP